MSTMVTLNMPFLYLNAADVPDHDIRLSGPAPAPPALPQFTDGDVGWDGPYGPTIETWDDISHPPVTPGVSYPVSVSGDPNPSWLLNSEIPTGWYTIKRRIK